MVTMPSARFFVALLGHTCMHGGSSQCWQPTGTNARCTSGHAPPLHAGRRRIGVPARRSARLATYAAAQIGHHGPAGHRRASAFGGIGVRDGPTEGPAFAICTRTMSAPEPVASVRSIDIVASVLRLGTPKSLANGVAQ